MYRELRYKRWLSHIERAYGSHRERRYSVMYRVALRRRYRPRKYPAHGRYHQRWRKSAQWRAKIRHSWGLLKPIAHYFWPWSHR